MQLTQVSCEGFATSVWRQRAREHEANSDFESAYRCYARALLAYPITGGQLAKKDVQQLSARMLAAFNAIELDRGAVRLPQSGKPRNPPAKRLFLDPKTDATVYDPG
jgi:hypothetical protein